MVAKLLGHRDEVLATDLQGQLVAVDNHPLDNIGQGYRRLQRGAQRVDDVVEVAPVGTRGAARQGHGTHQTSIARRVAASSGPEHAAADPDDLRAVFAAVLAAHLSSPFSSMVGGIASAACSASRIASSRLTPSGICWILSWSFRMACNSISGRGGHPGR